jgi:pimeloyl-ACP methyl ester carboxylesterase
MSRDFERAQAAVLARSGVAARSTRVAVPGGSAHVLVSGEGPPVVLVNGIGTPAAMWAPVMPHLKGMGLHAVDLPGFGLTQLDGSLTPDVRRKAVAFLVDVLDALQLERPMFVANSLGSLCTTWLSLDRPDRVAATAHIGCPALVLGTAAPLPMRLLSVSGLGALLERVQPPSPRQVRGLAKMVHEDPLPPELVELLVATERLPAFTRAFRPALHELLRLRGARPDVALTAEQLASIPHPVLLVWPADDPFGSPDVGQRAADLIPDAELHVVPGGHVPWVRHPQEVGRLVLPFLQRACAADVEAPG